GPQANYDTPKGARAMSDRRRRSKMPPQGEASSAQEGFDGALRLGTGRAIEEMAGLHAEIDRAAALLGDLLAESGPDRRRLIQEQPRFRALMLCELLLDRCRETWFTDPATAVELAELAVVVSDRLDGEHYGMGLVEDARARAWGHLANAWRIA